MANRSIVVPKIASQYGDARLYEVLNDIVRQASIRANEIDSAVTAVSSALMARVPTGSGMIWYTATAPDGWVLCDGSAVGRVGANAGIFALLGTTYGVGDGSTTFNLPDLRQKFPLGKAAAGTGSTLAGTGGAIDHLHAVDPPNTTSGANSTVRTVCVATPTVDVAGRTHTHDVDVASFNSGAANPPFLVVNFIIKQ